MRGLIFAVLTTSGILAALPAQSQAPPYTLVSTSLDWNGPHPIQYNPNGWHLAASDTSTGYNGLDGTASVGGLIEWGLARSFATGSGPGYYGRAQSAWADYLTITSGSLSGQSGTVTFAVNYDWDLDFTRNAPAGARGQVSLNLGNAHTSAFQDISTECNQATGCQTFGGTITEFADGGGLANTTGTFSDDGATGVFYATVPVVFGTQTGIFVSLSASVTSKQAFIAPSSASVFADQSLTWGGIVGVTDGNGNAVSYAAESASGFDYRNPYAVTSPVSEPGTAVLMLSALVGLAGVRILRRRQWSA